jgi:hypothetical protein
MWQLASKSLNLNDEAGGKAGFYARPGAAPRGQVVEPDRTAFATYSRSDEAYPNEQQ